ncbi:probable serpin E3 [Carassius auratus]|uniref:Probable serpin E3 n=1 Tax=Carassius auratus TaxID=7957 RepID=A0A6P6Q2A7_CARAU|nr:probable serpin E3 [Carassius auratus]XP_052421584.1 probable serpin E3 [Carassius gibelio]
MMHQLSVTSLLLCLWLLERCHGNSHNDLHTQFGISLYQTLTEMENNSNLIVSPASVSLCLGLLQFGARGNTRAQLEETLGYDVNDARVQDILSQPQGDLGNSSDRVRLQLANALFVHSGVKLLPEFTQHALGWGNSSLLSVNFSNPNHTHSRLQQWTRSQSKADDHLQTKEEQLQSSESQEEDSRHDSLLHMALLSTVVFHGAWQKQFLFTDTQNLPFSLSDGSTVKVPMMYQSTEVNIGHFRLPSEQEYTVLELPYLDRSLRLLVALPSDRKTSLFQLEKQLTARALGLWDTGLRRTKMDIFLPRFKMQSRFNLKPVLQSLGVSDVFSPSAADFRGISDGEGLFVSEAFHEARIEVTEEGTKAASATAMVLLKRSRSAVFKADRPFLFILRQMSTGSLLFIGRVLNPAEMS